MDERPDVIVLGCVKRKLRGRHRAADLYASPLWVKRRAYAEASGVPWFILSAKYGLLRPVDPIDHYDVKMSDHDRTARAALGREAAARLDRELGGLRGKRVEIHAGAAYVEALAPFVEERGGKIAVPLAGLSFGRQLQWYGGRGTVASAPQRDG